MHRARGSKEKILRPGGQSYIRPLITTKFGAIYCSLQSEAFPRSFEGRLAQLEERLPYKEEVTGSSPVPPTNLFNELGEFVRGHFFECVSFCVSLEGGIEDLDRSILVCG